MTTEQPSGQTSWASRIRRLRADPRIGSYTMIGKLLGANQVTVIRWAQGTHKPMWPFQEAISKMERDGYGRNTN